MPTVTANDIQIYYEAHGNGPALVMVHGLGTSHEDWCYQMPAFAAHFSVITYSQRGFGQSDQPKGPYSVELWAQDLLALLDELKIARCHLMGISLGGAVAYEFAATYPERLESLIILNSQPSFAIDTFRKHIMVWSRIGLAYVLGMKNLFRLAARGLFPKRQQLALRHQLLARYHTNRASYVAAIKAVADWSLGDRVGNLTMPILMLMSRHDYTSVAEKKALMATAKSVDYVVLENALHAAHWDSAQQVNEAVLDFLSALLRRG